MTRERLSQLNQEDLNHLADMFEIDFSENEDRAELEALVFEAMEDKRRESEDSNTFPISWHQRKFDNLDATYGDGGQHQSVFEFPVSYNCTRIELMLRDPAWAFCYWDIALHDKTVIVKDDGFQSLYLRLEETNPNKPAADLQVMDVPVQLADVSWYLNLPVRETCYRVHLVAVYDGREEVLATSQKIQVPLGALSEKLAVLDSFETDALIALSGIENLGVLGIEQEIPQRILSLKDKWED
jgi:hypothetical protein